MDVALIYEGRAILPDKKRATVQLHLSSFPTTTDLPPEPDRFLYGPLHKYSLEPFKVGSNAGCMSVTAGCGVHDPLAESDRWSHTTHNALTWRCSLAYRSALLGPLFSELLINRIRHSAGNAWIQHISPTKGLDRKLLVAERLE